MTALKVEFVDELPAPKHKAPVPTAEIAKFADQLRARPGDWAKYSWSDELSRRSRIQRASDINRQRISAPSPLREGFEAAFRDDTMYVRYLPAVETAAPAGASAGADLDPASSPPAGAADRDAHGGNA